MEAEVNERIAWSGAKIISLSGNMALQSERAGASTGASGVSRYPPSDIMLIALYEARQRGGESAGASWPSLQSLLTNT